MAPCCYVTLLQNLIELLKGHFRLVSEVYHYNLSLDEDQMPQELQPGKYILKKIS